MPLVCMQKSRIVKKILQKSRISPIGLYIGFRFLCGKPLLEAGVLLFMEPFLSFSEGFLESLELSQVDDLLLEREARAATAAVLDSVAREYPFPFCGSDMASLENLPFRFAIERRKPLGDGRAHETGSLEPGLHGYLRPGTSALDKRDEYLVDIRIEKGSYGVLVEHWGRY